MLGKINLDMSNIELGYTKNEDRLLTMVRLLRIDARKSLKEVATLIGTNKSTLSNMERGVTRMPVDVLMKLLRVYNVAMRLEDKR